MTKCPACGFEFDTLTTSIEKAGKKKGLYRLRKSVNVAEEAVKLAKIGDE